MQSQLEVKNLDGLEYDEPEVENAVRSEKVRGKIRLLKNVMKHGNIRPNLSTTVVEAA